MVLARAELAARSVRSLHAGVGAIPPRDPVGSLPGAAPTLDDVPTCHAGRLRRAARLSALLLPLLVVGGVPPELPPPELRIAFIGDQGRGAGARAVLELIAAEGADAVVHAGDFDYNGKPRAWNALIDSVLGPDFPYFACIGNHDKGDYYGANGYQELLRDRMLRLGIPWQGDLGVQSEFTWRGIHFVMTAPGVLAVGDGLYDLYIRERFSASATPWRISTFHKNQHRMQAGGKADETGWGVYEESRRAGAIVATGHEHSYARTHLLSSMQEQRVASDSSKLVLEPDDPLTPEDEGRSFAFVSGLGGQSIRDQEVFGDWFASVYSSTQGATDGALFGVFHVQGDPRLARFYFKDVDGNVIDEFTVRSLAGCDDADGAPCPRR
jgi:predicted phosphodiesterase